MMDEAVQFRTRGFAGHAHPRVKYGTLLVETHHSDMATAQAEIEAWQSRMRKGEVSRVELIDMRRGGMMSNTDIRMHTKLNWK